MFVLKKNALNLDTNSKLLKIILLKLNKKPSKDI